MKTRIIVGAITVSAGVMMMFAQDQGGQSQRPPGGGPPRGMFGGPLMEALDANKDGELDATEIANASAALKKLDKNSDGKLSADELRPQRPGGGRGPGGPGSPGGQGGGRPPRGNE